jgi:sugar (pentulose or hexulose) kinase
VATSFLLGLDVGTTSSKAVLFTPDGREVAKGRAPTPWRHVPSGAELDPVELLTAARAAMAQALKAAPAGTVAAVGVTSMAEAGVLLDRSGQPVAPLIAWYDSRDNHELAELTAVFGRDTFSSRTGLPLWGQWSITKHRWLVTNHPVASATRRLNVAEWIVRGLGGEEATDQSLASRTGWLDLATRRWWPEALEWSGASAALMPVLVTAGTPLGPVTDRAGIPGLTGAVLTLAGHDHQAAAVGAGAAGTGDELDSCGTADALVRTVPAGLPPGAVAELARAGITVGWHVLPDRWCLLAATQGGLLLQRVLGMLGADGSDLARLDTEALAAGTGPVAVHDSAGNAVTVTGVGDGVRPAHVWRAALETVTAQSRQIHDAMSAVVGPQHHLVATGGWSRSEALLRFKQDALGTLTRSPVGEAGTRGAALLAGVAAGVYAGPDDFPRPA